MSLLALSTPTVTTPPASTRPLAFSAAALVPAMLKIVTWAEAIVADDVDFGRTAGRIAVLAVAI